MEKDRFGEIMTQILSESHPYSMVLLFSLTHKIIHIFTDQVCSSFPLTSFMISCIELEVVCVQVSQSCPTLCNPVDCILPGSSVHGILQTRILERVAISFARGPSQPRDRTQVSCTAGGFFTS